MVFYMKAVTIKCNKIISNDVKDNSEKAMAPHSSILPWEKPMDRVAWQATDHRVAKSQTRLSDLGCIACIRCLEHLKGLFPEQSYH